MLSHNWPTPLHSIDQGATYSTMLSNDWCAAATPNIASPVPKCLWCSAAGKTSKSGMFVLCCAAACVLKLQKGVGELLGCSVVANQNSKVWGAMGLAVATDGRKTPSRTHYQAYHGSCCGVSMGKDSMSGTSSGMRCTAHGNFRTNKTPTWDDQQTRRVEKNQKTEMSRNSTKSSPTRPASGGCWLRKPRGILLRRPLFFYMSIHSLFFCLQFIHQAATSHGGCRLLHFFLQDSFLSQFLISYFFLSSFLLFFFSSFLLFFFSSFLLFFFSSSLLLNQRDHLTRRPASGDVILFFLLVV